MPVTMAHGVADQMCGSCEAKETVLLASDVDIQKGSNKQIQRGVSGGLDMCWDRLSLLLLSLGSSLSRVCQGLHR